MCPSQLMEILLLNLNYDGKLLLNKCYALWNDEEFTTEQAAYGIAFLIVRELTDLTAIARSSKGTRFDYWLGTVDTMGEIPFQNKVRLEVSGIRQGDGSRVKALSEAEERANKNFRWEIFRLHYRS